MKVASPKETVVCEQVEENIWQRKTYAPYMNAVSNESSYTKNSGSGVMTRKKIILHDTDMLLLLVMFWNLYYQFITN